MTRIAQLEMALQSIASHAAVLLALQRIGWPLSDEVLTSSDALFRAALALAQESEPAPAAADGDRRPCPHPLDARINFGAAGCSDFQCRVCGESVAVPHAAAARQSQQEP